TDGSFSISGPANATLVLTSIGYQRIEVGGSASMAVELTPTASTISEVIVVGYGTQRRKAVTGAISRVTGAELQTTAAPSFEAGLQGRVAGVQVSQSSGLAGAGSYVRVR